MTVLRDGRKVASFTTGEVGRQELLDLLTKHGTSGNTGTLPTQERGDVVLEVKGLVALAWQVSLEVGAGEVIALVGVQGAGQSAVVQALAGLRPPASGSVRLRGRTVAISSPSTSTRAGLLLVPADRRARGVVATMDVVENIALSPRSSSQRAGSASVERSVTWPTAT